ncbi:MAG: glycosyl transferase family 25, partial [Sulfitobacter sp.]|nr:glycosyl transferase family 25 [Sulfitobacter sp.]
SMIAAHMTPEMFIRLPFKIREKNGTVIAVDGDTRLLLPRKIGLQTGCQVVGREAAKRLLAKSEQIDRPIDTWLQMHWVTGQPVHTLLPNGLTEIAGQIGGSTIQQKTRTSGKLMREIKRAWYRAQVRMRPQRP